MNGLGTTPFFLQASRRSVYYVPRRMQSTFSGERLEKKIQGTKQVSCLEQIILENLDQFEERHWKVSFVALKKLSQKENDHELLLSLEKKWRPKLVAHLKGDPTSEFISTVAWNYARWGVASPMVVRGCYRSVREQGVRHFSTQHSCRMKRNV